MNLFNVIKNVPETGASYHQKKRKAEQLAEKWERATGLLKGLEGQDRTNFAILCQNQARKLVTEASSVGAMAGTDSWFNYAMPLIRRMWDSLNSTKFMSVQPLSIPTGLIFYLDVKYGNASQNAGKNALFTPGKSIYGFQTGDNFDLDSEIPTGGLYGAGKFGYSLNYKNTGKLTSSIATLGTGGSGSLSADDKVRIDHNETIINDYTVVSGSGSYKKITVTLADADKPYYDFRMQEASMLTGIEGLTIYPQFTRTIFTDGVPASVEFIGKYIVSDAPGADGENTSGSLNYVIAPTTEKRTNYEDQTNANQGYYNAELLDIADLDFDIYSKQIQAIGRKLKAKYTPELVQDINNYHAIDAEATITKICADHIATQVDLQNIALIGTAARQSGLIEYWSARPGYLYNKTTKAFTKHDNYVFSGQGAFGWYKTFGIKLTSMSNKINQRCGFGGVSYVIASPAVCTIIESMPGFNAILDKDNSSFGIGVQEVGKLDNKWTIYKNPKQTDNLCIVGYKGSSELEAGAVYAPYIPVEMTPKIFDANGSIRKILSTRYANAVTRPELFGLIIVDGLATV